MGSLLGFLATAFFVFLTSEDFSRDPLLDNGLTGLGPAISENTIIQKCVHLKESVDNITVQSQFSYQPILHQQQPPHTPPLLDALLKLTALGGQTKTLIIAKKILDIWRTLILKLGLIGLTT